MDSVERLARSLVGRAKREATWLTVLVVLCIGVAWLLLPAAQVGISAVLAGLVALLWLRVWVMQYRTRHGYMGGTADEARELIREAQRQGDA